MRLLVLTMAFLLSLPSQAADDCSEYADALQWIERMSRSLREVSYEGVFTYQHGKTMQSMRISHSVNGDLATGTLTHLDGSGGTVTRTAHPLDCIHPGSKLVRISSGFGPEDCGLAKVYRLQLGGEGRVAGRRAQLLRVLPRDMYRFGYQMALDFETGLLLHSQTLAQDGRVLEQFQFADLKLGPVAHEGTEVEVLHEAGHPDSRMRAAIAGYSRAGNTWQVGWVPNGFTPTNPAAGASADKTFTDGLAVFSVFLERLERELQPGEGRARQGGTTAYTRGMHLSGQPVLVTVVGEVPMSTARMVADSVNWMVAADAN